MKLGKRSIMILEGIGLAAIAYLLTDLGVEPLRPDLEKHIVKLHPSVRTNFRAFFREVEATTGHTIIYVSGHRGWVESQQIWNSNPAVQACCPVGKDYHFFGFAVDISLKSPTGAILSLNTPSSFWEATGIREIARKYKMRWGINFPGYYDPVHFDMPIHNIADLVNRAITKNGSLQNTEGPQLDTTGLPLRQYTTA
jgi:hypothetical protein